MEDDAAHSLTRRREIDAVVARWLAGGEQVLHLEGPPGSGKTSWVKLLIADGKVRDESGRQLAIVAAYHFCRRNDARSASVVAFLERIGSQLAQLEPRFAKAFAERSGRRRGSDILIFQDLRGSTGSSAIGAQISNLILQGISPADLLDELLSPLEKVLSDVKTNWLIVVDAPDEPAETGIADLLIALGKMPSRLRWIITSRPNIPFGRRLASIGAEQLDLSKIAIRSPSLADFLRKRATSNGLLARLTPGLKPDAFLAALFERVQDNFLVARCALDALAQIKGPISLGEIGNLPNDLQNYFHIYISRLPHEMLEKWTKECGPLLGSLAVARSPLSEPELAVITGLTASLVRERLTRLQAYLQGGRHGWRLFHSTFAEFLLNEDEADELWCPEPEQHARLVKWIMGSQDWALAPTYGLTNLVSHAVASGGPEMLLALDRALEPGLIAARVKAEGGTYGLAADFKQALAAVSARGDVNRTFFLTMLLSFWQDRAAAAAAPSSTILLAAMGRVAEASALALRQDAAGHAEQYEALYQRAGYASRLVDIGELEAAIDFAREAEAEGESQTIYSVVEALAVHAPARALALLKEPPFVRRPPHLSQKALRSLARSPEGVLVAVELAEGVEERIAVAEGCASHDLDQALELVRDAHHYPVWIGGERLGLRPEHAKLRVLTAFVKVHGDRAATAWTRATKELEFGWPEPYGFLLAAEIAACDPVLAEPAFCQLTLPDWGIHRSIAAAWMGVRGGPMVLQALAGRIATLRPSGEADQDELDRQYLFLGLRSALQMLALISPKEFLRETEMFRLLERIGDIMLDALTHNKDIPERKSSGARELGVLLGWLGQNFVERIYAHGEANWRNESWSTELGKGVAISMAHQGVETYLAMKDSAIKEIWWEGALRLAGEIIAQRDPYEALRLVDSIPPYYSNTRLDLIGITAVAMCQTGRGQLDNLPSLLSGYTQSALFQARAKAILRILDNTPDIDPVPDAARVLQKVNEAASRKDYNALLIIVDEVVKLSKVHGQPYRGEIIWASQVRRTLADALEQFDAELAFTIILPVANFEEVRARARKISTLLLPDGIDAIAHAIANIADEAHISMDWIWWYHELVLAFTLEVPTQEREPLLDEVLGKNSSPTKERVSRALVAFEDPQSVIAGLVGRTSQPDFLWLGGHALAEICRRDSGAAFDALIKITAGNTFGDFFLARMGYAWPIKLWREGLAAFIAFVKSDKSSIDPWILSIGSFAEIILVRVGYQDPVAALAKLDEILSEWPNFLELSDCERKIIVSAAQAGSSDPSLWPVLVKRAQQIAESSPRASALEGLLSSLKRINPEAQARCTSLVLGSIGSGPREPVFRMSEALALAAVRADPAMTGHGEALFDRLTKILAVTQV